MGLANDAETRARAEAFELGLEREGWSIGKDLQIVYRFSGGNLDWMQAFAKELVALKPDCILGHSTPVNEALMQATRSIPIVFVSVTDPIGSKFVASMARPGRNVNFTSLYRELFITLAARCRIPAIYPYRYFVEAGGRLSYGVDALDLLRRAAAYVSRILRGTNPADLPVLAPTKFELAINLNTAKDLGLVVPKVLLAGADSLIG